MNSKVSRAARDGVIIAALVGIPAAIFANGISQTLFTREPDWQYLTISVLLVIVLVLTRSIMLEPQADRLHAEELVPAPPFFLAKAVHEASRTVDFAGILAKRSVNDDEFKAVLASRARTGLKLRFLMVDPQSDAFRRRAAEEGESAKSWALELDGTIERLSQYQRDFGLSIRVRYTTEYPIWRMIVVDKERVWVNAFLPGKRGTESPQHHYADKAGDLACGFSRYFDSVWSRAAEVPL